LQEQPAIVDGSACVHRRGESDHEPEKKSSDKD
jgi:hypothetical protein